MAKFKVSVEIDDAALEKRGDAFILDLLKNWIAYPDWGMRAVEIERIEEVNNG